MGKGFEDEGVYRELENVIDFEKILEDISKDEENAKKDIISVATSSSYQKDKSSDDISNFNTYKSWNSYQSFYYKVPDGKKVGLSFVENYFRNMDKMNEEVYFSSFDYAMLIDLFHIKSPSGSEDDMQLFILDYLDKMRIPYTVDKGGNIYNLNYKDRPLMFSHMDTVQRKDDLVRVQTIDYYLTKEKRIVIYGDNCVIGADDKNGIFIVLSLISAYKDKGGVNFAFFVEEEIFGNNGSELFIKQQHMTNIPYGLLFDRRGSGDIICLENGYGSKKFDDELEKVSLQNRMSFKSVQGGASDANNISKKINCANLSCGYYNPHAKSEYTYVDEIIHTFRYATQVIDALDGKKFELENYYGSSYESESSYGKDYYKGSSYNDLYDDDNDFYGSEYGKLSGARKISKSEARNLIYVKSIDMYLTKEKTSALLEELEDYFYTG